MQVSNRQRAAGVFFGAVLLPDLAIHDYAFMETRHDLPITAGAAEDQPSSRSPGHGFRFPWTDSVWLGLAISIIVGLLYTLVLLGPAVVNPHNIGWLWSDASDHFIAWELLRQDPHWHWPLTYTDRVGYPLGENVALMDPNPLLAVLFKAFSPLLPEPFQYFGIQAVLICTLQFFFSIRLFRLILGQNPFGILLCSLFFLVAPPLAWRLRMHFALSNHWLVVAALLIYFQAQRESPQAIRRFVIAALLLAGLGVAINPYPAFQVLVVLTAAAGSLLWQRRLSLPKALGFMAAMGLTCAIVAYALGFFIVGGKGYGLFGYRSYSLNLLAPFDPEFYGSILSRLLPRFPHGTVHSGNYLGAGIIFLLIFLLILFVLQPGKLRSLDRRQVVPLVLCCLGLTLMALSTKVMIGPATLVDFDPQQHLTRFLAPLRVSERLFWAPYYTILAAVLAAPFLLFRRSQANWLLAIVLVVQLVDIAPLIKWVHSDVNRPRPLWLPLTSPVWSRLGSVHENLVVLPAWQCSSNSSPGQWDGFRIFGFLAVAQKMRTNSYFSARYTLANSDFHCKQSIAALAERPLSPDAAYVVTPALAAVIAKGPTGPGKCHEVDSFILCSSKTDFGLPPEDTPKLDEKTSSVPGKQH